MKADFEKGTKVCSKCKKELPIEMFYKDKGESDGLHCCCKQCHNLLRKEWRSKNEIRVKAVQKMANDRNANTFGGTKEDRGRGTSRFIKRDYELSKEQLKRRQRCRKGRKYKTEQTNPQGIVIWYDGKLNELDYKSYYKILHREYNRQKVCAIRGYVGKVKLKPSEHFLFDFDLEQMLKDNVYYSTHGGKYKKHITKWWDGEIRHWTVNDGIWKK